MPDRNGTIKRLQDSLKVVNGWCCRTDSLDDPIMNVERAIEDALELLKGQESVEPILALNDGEHKLWQCGNCKVAVFTRDTKYCHNCGKAVRWDA